MIGYSSIKPSITSCISKTRSSSAYTGNYDAFERRRAERMMNQQAMHEKQMAQKAHMQKFVDRFRASAAKARRRKAALKPSRKWISSMP